MLPHIVGCDPGAPATEKPVVLRSFRPEIGMDDVPHSPNRLLANLSPAELQNAYFPQCMAKGGANDGAILF